MRQRRIDVVKGLLKSGKIILASPSKEKEPTTHSEDVLKFVLACNHEHFEIWRRDNNLSPQSCVYVDSERRIMARHLTYNQIVVLDSFWQREDATRLYDAVQNRVR